MLAGKLTPRIESLSLTIFHKVEVFLVVQDLMQCVKFTNRIQLYQAHLLDLHQWLSMANFYFKVSHKSAERSKVKQLCQPKICLE